MRALIETVKSDGIFLFKKPTEILYEIGPKVKNCFEFWEVDKKGEIKNVCLTSTVHRVTKQGSIWRVRTKTSEYELKRVK